jgi:hypothetical protein
MGVLIFRVLMVNVGNLLVSSMFYYYFYLLGWVAPIVGYSMGYTHRLRISPFQGCVCVFVVV